MGSTSEKDVVQGDTTTEFELYQHFGIDLGLLVQTVELVLNCLKLTVQFL